MEKLMKKALVIIVIMFLSAGMLAAFTLRDTEAESPKA